MIFRKMMSVVLILGCVDMYAMDTREESLLSVVMSLQEIESSEVETIVRLAKRQRQEGLETLVVAIDQTEQAELHRTRNYLEEDKKLFTEQVAQFEKDVQQRSLSLQQWYEYLLQCTSILQTKAVALHAQENAIRLQRSNRTDVEVQTDSMHKVPMIFCSPSCTKEKRRLEQRCNAVQYLFDAHKKDKEKEINALRQEIQSLNTQIIGLQSKNVASKTQNRRACTIKSSDEAPTQLATKPTRTREPLSPDLFRQQLIALKMAHAKEMQELRIRRSYRRMLALEVALVQHGIDPNVYVPESNISKYSDLSARILKLKLTEAERRCQQLEEQIADLQGQLAMMAVLPASALPSSHEKRASSSVTAQELEIDLTAEETLSGSPRSDSLPLSVSPTWSLSSVLDAQSVDSFTGFD